MKTTSSGLTGVVLVLVMVVLVLSSLFWFLYQGWGDLEERAEQADVRATRIGDLEQELGQMSASLTAVQATRDALTTALDEAIEAHQVAEAETIQEQEAKDLLATQVATLTQQLQVANQSLSAAQDIPLVTILFPGTDSVVPLTEAVEILAVAADDSGLDTVYVGRDGEVVAVAADGAPLYEVRMEWTPGSIGEHTVVITAVNISLIASQPVSVTFQVVDTEGETAVASLTNTAHPARQAGAATLLPFAGPGAVAALLFGRRVSNALPDHFGHARHHRRQRRLGRGE